jgi:4-amino-4-deoxy-L-arabinose transferase-like glycosyltransferase
MYALTFMHSKTETHRRRFGYTILLLSLVAAAFAVRAFLINDIPSGVYPDEAVNGTDALTAWENRDFRWFYENNNGREGLYINLIALSTALFGNTVFALKLWSILAGTLAVLGVYLLGKELFASRRAGIIAAFLMAFSFWAINFSRIGFRASFVALILTFSFFFLFQGIRTKRIAPFVWSGLIFGIGFHTYIAFRLAPAILLVIAIALLLSQQRVIRTYWKHALAFLVAMMITAAPIAFNFITHPEHIGSRSGSISVFSPEVNDGDLVGTIVETTSLSIAKYFVWGDQNWRHNFPPFPILDPLTAISLGIGLVWIIQEWFRCLWRRIRYQERDYGFVISSFLLGSFVIMLAPEFLTAEGIPHALRAIGTQPFVFLIAALPLLHFFREADKYTSRIWMPLSAALSLIFIAILNLGAYFFLWGQTGEMRNAFDTVFTEQARYLQTIPENHTAYILANGPGQSMDDGLPVSAKVIQYFTFHQENIIFLEPETYLTTPAIFIPMRGDESVFSAIEHYFGDRAVRQTITSPKYPDISFDIVRVSE